MVVTMLERQGVEVDDRYRDSILANGGNIAYLTRLATFVRQDRSAQAIIEDNIRKMRETEQDMQSLRERWRAKHKEKWTALDARNQESAFTSAVLQTRPISGGAHYSKQHGGSGMGPNDEYGFHPGDVTFDDIAKVYLVKNGKVVAELSPEQAEQKIDWIETAKVGER